MLAGIRGDWMFFVIIILLVIVLPVSCQGGMGSIDFDDVRERQWGDAR